MLGQAYYYCLTVRIVYNMFVQHLCVTPAGRERRHIGSLTLCIPITIITSMRRVGLFHVNFIICFDI